VIEQILERSGTPYFSFKDLDENRPANSIKLRVETIDYFLKRYRADMLRRKNTEADIGLRMAEYEQRLRTQATDPS
jgi:predicted nucleotide-binding protein (sugar kinase/HSP70/actin superfamily)